MKKISKWILCLTLVVCIIIPTLFVSAATGYTQASDVNYVKAENKYVVNWGDREEDATFLSTYAQDFYKTGNTFEDVIALNGGTSVANAPKSELYTKLKKIMTDAHTYIISYDATRYLFRYTDCIKNDSTQISSFYSGDMFAGTWDSGKTWNREHTWPNSKGNLAGNGENDIMMLRPTLKSENGSRSNKAYGTTSAYYNPNAESGGKYDLRGDVSRIILYQYTRWGCINTGSGYNPVDIFGTGGVIESLDVLLDWMEEDPVDTWEMGRNDAVQSITGTRNVFVDYPEYAWALFGEDCPDDLVTPSGNADLVPDASDRPDTPDEPEEPAGPALVDTPVVGTAYKFGLLQGNIGKTIFINGEMAKTYYFGSTEDPTAAIDVTLEQATGGYYLAAKIDGAKKYINLVTSGTHVNAVYQDTASSVYTLDTANKMLVTNVNGTPYALGTYNSFDTISPSKTSYSGNFWCWFYTTTATPEEPDTPVVPPIDPENPEDPENPQEPDCENGLHIYSDDQDLFCNECGKYKITEPTLLKEDGVWYYYNNGVYTNETTLVKYNGKWFYVEEGAWNSETTTLVKYSGKWFYIKNGKWDSSTEDLVKHSGKWFYIKSGKWNSSSKTLFNKNDSWFYINKGKWDSDAKCIFKYNGKNFYITGGKWKSTTNTLFKKDGKYYAIKSGKWYKGKNIIKYNGKKYYVNKGYAQTSFSGKVTISGKKYTVKKGIIK